MNLSKASVHATSALTFRKDSSHLKLGKQPQRSSTKLPNSKEELNKLISFYFD